MNEITQSNILDLPINNKEKYHQNRNCLGYHVYMLKYYFDFNLLSNDQKREKIICNLGIRYGPPGDESIHSSDLLQFQKINHHNVMKISSFNWSRLQSTQFKEVWKERACNSNNRKLPGKFLVDPGEILNEEEGEDYSNILEINVMITLTYK